MKRRVAALEKVVADAPKKGAAKPHSDNGIPFLRSQLTSTEVQLDDANRKLSDARLGQSLESNQESERLQVIEQPVASPTPVKPKRPKLFALVFALAAMCGFGIVGLAETFDRSIHRMHDLAGIVDSRLVLAIPYIMTVTEERRKRTKMILLFGIIAIIMLGALAVALYLGLDLQSWSDQSWWLDRLTHLSESGSGPQPQQPLQ